MQIFQKVIYFQIQSSYDIIIGISQGLVTLPFLKVEAQNLVGYLDMFIKVSVFHKYYFICWYVIAETVFDTNDVIMTSLKGTHFILATRTDHRVTRK